MQKRIMVKYPQIYREITEASKFRYNNKLKDEIMRHKKNHIELINKANSHNNLYFK